MPPRPGGVAIATIVSSEENMRFPAARCRRGGRNYCLAEMMTVFMNASPMLSELTVGSSAMAMCTIRRSYGFNGPISWGIPLDLQAFTAAADQDATIFAFEVDARPFRRFFDGNGEGHAHRVHDAVDEVGDLFRQGLIHAASSSTVRSCDRQPPYDLRRRSSFGAPQVAAWSPEPAARSSSS